MTRTKTWSGSAWVYSDSGGGGSTSGIAAVDLPSNLPSSGVSVGEMRYVRGRLNAFDGGGGLFKVHATDGSGTADGGITFKNGSVRWVREWDKHGLNLSWFGASGALSGGLIVNSTTTIQAAVDAACLHQANILVPSGFWGIDNIQLTNTSGIGSQWIPEFIGIGLQRSYFRYIGAGGSGSRMFTIPRADYGGFRRIWMIGNGDTKTNMVETILYYGDGALTDGNADIMHAWEDLALGSCYGDAVVFETQPWNLHIANRVRFDTVGGYSIVIKGSNSAERRPITINNWTVDNQGMIGTATISGIGWDAATARWGKSFIKVENGRQLDIHVGPGRMETNNPMKTGVPLILHETATQSGQRLKFSATGLSGYAYEGTAAGFTTTEPVPLIQSETGRIRIKLEDHGGVSATRARYYDVAATKYHGVGLNRNQHHFEWGPEDTYDYGLNLQDRRIQILDKTSPLNFTRSQPGDIFLYPNSAYSPVGKSDLGFVVVNPAGFSIPAGNTDWSTGLTTNASTSVTITSLPMDHYVGDYIVVVGGGAAGVDLSTNITAVNYSTNVITLANAIANTGTNVSRTIRMQGSVLRDIGGNWASAAPSSGSWLVGEKVWNTVPAGGGATYVGWVCTTAGSPGTWKGFGLIQT